MPALSHRLGIGGFAALLGAWRPARSIAAVHLRQTPHPEGARFAGPATIEAARQADMAGFALGDAAQHATVAPDGSLWTGRHWDAPVPPRSRGGQAFTLSMLGDADGADRLEGVQREAALKAVALVQDRFGLPVDAVRFIGLGSPRAPPRAGALNQAAFINALRNLRGGASGPTGIRGRGQSFAAARAWLEEGPPPMDEADIIPPQDGRPPPDAARSIDPGVLASLRPHVIALWGGRLSQGGLFQTDQHDVDRIFEIHLPERVKQLGPDQVLPIVLYAHGGLVSEAAGLQIAANQVSWWNANGCYPLHFVWQTGLFEQIERLLGLQRAATRGLSDVSDAIVETTVRAVGGPQIWNGMKYAASSAFEVGAAGTAVVKRIVDFANAHRGKVRLHAVGHSAGAIFHAHMLRQFELLDGPALETLSLLAPAITVADYERLADPLVPRRAKRVRLFTMSKDFERADTVTFAYRKSLLYLICHALEPKPDEPILGLEDSLVADPRLVERFGLKTKPSDTGEVVWSQTAATTGLHASRSTSHGGFDNDVPTMDSVLRGILAISDATPLARSFPPDTEARAAVAPRDPVPLAASDPEPQPAPLPVPAAAASVAAGAATGRLRALCVGINAYPEGYTLRGCVADAQAWQAALTGLGFAVDTIFDAGATKANIVSRLRTMLQQSRPGDVLVFQYSGHGTEWAPGKVATCPVDFVDGSLLTDDEIRAVCDTLPPGVRLTCFMDNCYSYSVTRFAGYHPPQAGPGQIARFVTLTPAMIARFEAKQPGARSAAMAATRDISRPQSSLRWVTFSACDSNEVAYETLGHGDFSTIAVPLLTQPGLTNRQFEEGVVSRFGAQPRQHPKLDCRPEAQDEPFLARAAPGDRAAEAPVPPARPAASSQTGAVADLLEAIARLIR